MWLMAMFGGQCVHCQRTLQDVNPDRDDYVVADRIIPGGSYRRSNIQASCAPCNAARGDDMSWTYEDGHAISR
jgi:5-methylcytosine-specific restriction endonuclease McrA